MTLHTDRPSERRPIASRDLPVFRALAAALARARVSANAISAFGLLCGCAAGAAFAATARAPDAERWLWLGGAALVQLRLLCNLLDGMVAVARGTASPVGELWNDVPDRVSDVATLLGLGAAAGSDPRLGFGAACVALFVAYVRVIGAAAGARHQWCGPMAKAHRMFAVTVTALYLALAPAAWQPGFGLARAALLVITALGLATALRRLLRIAAELRSRP